MSASAISKRKEREIPLLSWLSRGPEATRKFAHALGRVLPAGSVLALAGNLGSGKTVFVQGLARGLGFKRKDEVRSPTYLIIQEHPGRIPLCHADLYRLSAADLPAVGLEEYWRRTVSRKGQLWVTAVEWADRAPDQIPKGALWIRFKIVSRNEREILFSGNPSHKRFLKKIKT